MRYLLSFIKKEWMEHLRSGRLLILGMVFMLFGIMNPAIAKFTPWLMESGIFTKEYQSGTLILALTKGVERYKVVVAKSVVLVVVWTVGYWLCFGITYLYNAYFWDNSIAENLMFSVGCWWLFGLWVIALLVLFSVLADSNGAVLCGTGGVAFGSYLLGLFPKLKECLPTLLMDGNSLIYGATEAEKYYMALGVTGATSLACFVLSILIFNKTTRS